MNRKIISILVACLYCLLISATVFSADFTVTGVARDVRDGDKQYTYALSTSVTLDNGTMVYKLDTPKGSGKIIAAAVTTASTDCDFWLSVKDAQAKNSIYTILQLDSVDADGFIPEILPIPFHNEDTTIDNYLYLSIDNLSATATGTGGYFKLTFEGDQR